MNATTDISTNITPNVTSNVTPNASTDPATDLATDKTTIILNKIESMITTIDKFSDSINNFSIILEQLSNTILIFTDIVKKQQQDKQQDKQIIEQSSSSNENVDEKIRCYYADRRWHYDSPIATYNVTRKHYNRRTNIIFEENIYMCSNCLKKESFKNNTIIKSELLI